MASTQQRSRRHKLQSIHGTGLMKLSRCVRLNAASPNQVGECDQWEFYKSITRVHKLMNELHTMTELMNEIHSMKQM